MSTMITRKMTAVGVAGTLALAADQIGKSLAVEQHGNMVMPLRNQGFSLQVITLSLQVEVTAMAIALVIAAAVLYRWIIRGIVPALPVGLLLGGGASNLLDRLLYGSVRDFLVVGHAVVINPADVAVLVGLTAVVLARLHHTAPAPEPFRRRRSATCRNGAQRGKSTNTCTEAHGVPPLSPRNRGVSL